MGLVETLERESFGAARTHPGRKEEAKAGEAPRAARFRPRVQGPQGFQG